MADTKISAGADPGALLGTDKIPLARTPSTTAFAATMAEVAAFAGTVAATPSVNYADNSGFAINQRGYVSGAALAAGIYGFDRWKAGAGGCTLTFTASPPSTVVTITAGTFQQVVEGASIQGGNYTLSWVGTAQGRVGGGAYAVSPVAVTGATAGANVTIEFNAGTLSQVKFVAGTAATAWLAKPARDELSNCQRFYGVGQGGMTANGTAGQGMGAYVALPGNMRATPTVAISGTPTYFNCATAAVAATTSGYAVVTATVTATGLASFTALFTANADL